MDEPKESSFDQRAGPIEPDTTLYRCERDGQFYSKRTAHKHAICARIQDERDSGYHPLYGVVQG